MAKELYLKGPMYFYDKYHLVQFFHPAYRIFPADDKKGKIIDFNLTF